MTNVPGVFTAGDMQRSQSLIVWAIDESRMPFALRRRGIFAPSRRVIECRLEVQLPFSQRRPVGPHAVRTEEPWKAKPRSA
jgi:hypothetical protein